MRTVKVRILPPQPIFFNQDFGRAPLVSGDRQTRFQPALPTAVHRFDVAVAHFLQIVCHKCGTESPAAFLANERTRFTKFQRVFSDDRSPSPGILPFPLLIIQKSSPSVIFSIEVASRQSWSSSFMSAARSPLPSPVLP